MRGKLRAVACKRLDELEGRGDVEDCCGGGGPLLDNIPLIRWLFMLLPCLLLVDGFWYDRLSYDCDDDDDDCWFGLPSFGLTRCLWCEVVEDDDDEDDDDGGLPLLWWGFLNSGGGCCLPLCNCNGNNGLWPSGHIWRLGSSKNTPFTFWKSPKVFCICFVTLSGLTLNLNW